MRKILLSIILFFLSFIINAQVDTTALRTNLDEVLEDATTNKEDAEYFDMIEFLLQNKISLNEASINDLLMIPYLDRQSATAIIRHRNLLGSINGADQLKAIEGVSLELIEKILPFLQFEKLTDTTFFRSLSEIAGGIDFSFRSRIIEDIQREEAFRANKYEGSNLKFYNRLIISKDKNIRFGVLMEKDQGEKTFNDFTTLHFYAKEIGIIKSFVAGDYLFEFGQGLALWSRYSISKGTETIGILPRNGKGIIPYLSADENMFLRGCATQISFNGFNFTAFFSDKKLDGSVDPLTDKITSIRLDGYHRNSNEAAHKKIITEKLFGISADYTITETSSLGLLYYYSKFGSHFQNVTPLDPSGNTFEYFSASYNILFKQLSFSGETSYNNKSLASINSAEITINKNFALLFSFRNYPIDYWGLHTNGFGEKDGTQNETGFYYGLKLRTNYGTFYFYYDQFIFPYTSEKIPFTSSGNEFLVYYTIKPITNTEVRLRYSNQYKDVPAVINNEYGLLKKRSENFRCELIYKVSKFIQLRSRLNLTGISPSSNSQSEKGFLLFQDVKYSPLSVFNLSARIVFFRTDSYDSRVYEFENDLTGVMTNPPLYGEGARWYLLAHYKTGFGLSLTIKYSELFKPNERTLGTGDAEIIGNIDNRLSFQMDLQF